MKSHRGEETFSAVWLCFEVMGDGGEKMAKDDYFVIVYQVLAYLYQRLKKGETVDPAVLRHDSPLLRINEKYWAYILYHMQEDGLIEGVAFLRVDGVQFPYVHELEACRITPDGIAYLCDNSFMEKAKRFLKDVNEIIPF